RTALGQVHTALQVPCGGIAGFALQPAVDQTQRIIGVPSTERYAGLVHAAACRREGCSQTSHCPQQDEREYGCFSHPIYFTSVTGTPLPIGCPFVLPSATTCPSCKPLSTPTCVKLMLPTVMRVRCNL